MKYIFPAIFFMMLVYGYLSILRVPYHFYQEGVTSGIDSAFLKLDKLPPSLYSAEEFPVVRTPGVVPDQEILWQNFHFNDFVIPFPIRHPRYRLKPYIIKEAGEYHFGVQVLDYNLKVLNQLVFRNAQHFKLELYRHKIFQLPLFENAISEKGLRQVWKDMFALDIDSSAQLVTPSYAQLYLPSQIPLTKMVYDLFILTLRDRFLPKRTESLFYREKGGLGVVEIGNESGDQSRFLQETFYNLEGNEVYTVEVLSLKGNLAAEKFRQRLVKNIQFKKSFKDSSIPIYAKFQGMNYQEKLTIDGLIYLYSAFSHQKKSEKFLRQAIQFMERGTEPKEILKPLYDYGFKVFGSSFSKFVDELRESPQQRLEREMKKEEEKKRLQMINEEILDEPESFKNDNEKIKFYLQKAKEEEEGLEEEGKTLILE